MRILLNGCNGKMGQVMTRVLAAEKDMEVIAGVDLDPSKYKNGYPVYASLDAVSEVPDILVDFSHHTGLPAVLKYG